MRWLGTGRLGQLLAPRRYLPDRRAATLAGTPEPDPVRPESVAKQGEITKVVPLVQGMIIDLWILPDSHSPAPRQVALLMVMIAAMMLWLFHRKGWFDPVLQTS